MSYGLEQIYFLANAGLLDALSSPLHQEQCVGRSVKGAETRFRIFIHIQDHSQETTLHFLLIARSSILSNLADPFAFLLSYQHFWL